MAYVDDICLPLIRVLEHNASLQVHQVAGHAANIDFWVAEVLHALAVIDGYPERFEKLRWAQADYERDHPHQLSDAAGWVEGKFGSDPLLTRSSPNADRQRLRRHLLKAAGKLIDRTEREGLIEPEKADALREKIAGAG